MWPVDYVRAPGWIEQQSPRTRVLLTFAFFTVSMLFGLRGLWRFPLAESLFDSVFTGAVIAGAMVWRDRRRPRQDAQAEVSRSR